MSEREPLVEQIARAVLYEGYILYPYRPSVKSRQRWTFGGVYPKAFSDANPGGADGCAMQAQCLLESGDERSAAIDVRVRFLHLTARTVEAGDHLFHAVSSLDVDGRSYHPWQEAEEREIRLDALSLHDCVQAPCRRAFTFDHQRVVELLQNADGETVGRLVREQEAIDGTIDVSVEIIGAGLFRVTARIANRTPFAAALSRDDAVMRSFASSHIVLTARHASFVSLTDPPDALRDAVDACQNVGCWPVLVGADGARDTMLCSPIILPDYPHVAAQSPGDLFDGTEIDEILTLRILTLTDEEKRQAAATDARVGAMLARTESLPVEQRMNLHGTVRDLRELAPAQAEMQEVRHG